jgi:hypothetical protein
MGPQDPLAELGDSEVVFADEVDSNLRIKYRGCTYHVDKRTIRSHSSFLSDAIAAMPRDEMDLELPASITTRGPLPATTTDLELVLTWMYYPYWSSSMPYVAQEKWSEVLGVAKEDDKYLAKMEGAVVFGFAADKMVEVPRRLEKEAIYLMDYLGCARLLERAVRALETRLEDLDLSASTHLPFVLTVLDISCGMSSELQCKMLSSVARLQPSTKDIKSITSSLSRESLGMLVQQLYAERPVGPPSNGKRRRSTRKRQRRAPSPLPPVVRGAPAFDVVLDSDEGDEL